MRFIEEHNEVKPTFSPEVQTVQTAWEDYKVYVTSLEPAVAAKETEYFIGNLIERIIEDLCKLEVEDLLKKLGYLK